MRRWLAVAFAGLTLAACTQGRPIYPSPIAPQGDIDVLWRPTQGQRLVVRRTISLTPLGLPGEKSIPVGDRRLTQSVTFAHEYQVGPHYVDIRFTEDETTLPMTVRFSKDGQLQTMLLDDASSLAEQERMSLDRFVEDVIRPLFLQVRALFGRWRMGETRVIDVPFPSAPGFNMRITVSATFLRVAHVHGRRAAEFALMSDGNMIAQQVANQNYGTFTITGTSWYDLDTGVTLGGVSKAHARLTTNDAQFPLVQFDLLQEDRVDFSKSRF